MWRGPRRGRNLFGHCLRVCVCEMLWFVIFYKNLTERKKICDTFITVWIGWYKWKTSVRNPKWNRLSVGRQQKHNSAVWMFYRDKNKRLIFLVRFFYSIKMEPLKRAKQRTNKNIWIELVRNQYQRHANTDAQQYIHTHEIHWNHFILSSNVRSLLNYSHMSIFIKICPNILNGDTRIFKFEVCVHKSIMSRFNDWIKKTANNINKQRKWKKKKHLKTIKSFFFFYSKLG